MSAPESRPQPRPGIMKIAAYVGGKGSLPGIADPIRLAANESALGPSPKAIAAYQAAKDSLHRYAEGGASALREALGAQHGLDPDRIVVGNGSDEIIGLLARAYAGPGDEVLFSRHGFAMYPIATLSAGATPVMAPEQDYRTDVDAMLDAVTERTKIVFLANPNNPTGSYVTAGEVDAPPRRPAIGCPVRRRRRLCRICHAQRLYRRAGAGAEARQCRDDAHFLQDFRAGRAAGSAGATPRRRCATCCTGRAGRSTSTARPRRRRWRRWTMSPISTGRAPTTISGCPGFPNRSSNSA